jgi:hypothetical protein
MITNNETYDKGMTSYRNCLHSPLLAHSDSECKSDLIFGHRLASAPSGSY